MADPVALSVVPRPELYDEYDSEAMEYSFQALELDLAEKLDRRSHVYMDPGKELVLTSDDSSAQYGLGIDSTGYLRLRDMSDGTIGTFSVAWAQVDGASQEITNLTSYIDTQDAALQSSVTVNALAVSNNTTSIAGIETEITAARDGEASLNAKFTNVEGAIVTEAGARAAADTAIEAAFAAGDVAVAAAATSYTDAAVSAEGAARATAIDTVEASLRTEASRENLIPADFQILREQDWRDNADMALFWNLVASDTGVQSPYLAEDAFVLTTTAADARMALTPNIGSSYFSDIADRASRVFIDSAKTYAARLRLQPSATTSVTLYARHSGGGLYTVATTTDTGDTEFTADWSPSLSGYYSFELQVSSASGGAACWVYRLQLVEKASGELASDIPFLSQSTAGEKALSAQARILQDAFIDDGVAIAKIVLEAAASGSDPARLGLRSGGGSSDIALQAAQIFFGSDTTFEDANDTIYVEQNSYRLRILGPFGSSSDLILWYGPDSVSLNSETKTNGVFALATDGKVYYGNAELLGASDPFTADISAAANGVRSGAGSVTSNSVTATFSNGSGGGVTYRWSVSPADSSENVTITSPTSASTTLSATVGSTDNFFGGLTCFVTDTDTGVTAVATTSYSLSAI